MVGFSPRRIPARFLKHPRLLCREELCNQGRIPDPLRYAGFMTCCTKQKTRTVLVQTTAVTSTVRQRPARCVAHKSGASLKPCILNAKMH